MIQRIKNYIIKNKKNNLLSGNFFMGFTCANILAFTTNSSNLSKWTLLVSAIATASAYAQYYYADYEESDQRPAENSSNDLFL